MDRTKNRPKKLIKILLSISLALFLNSQADLSFDLKNKDLGIPEDKTALLAAIKTDFKKIIPPINLLKNHYFIANKGQLPASVDFYLEDKARRLLFSSEGIFFLLAGENQPGAVKIKFRGQRKGVRPIGLGESKINFSFFKGQEEHWVVNVPGYEAICYPDLWPGIDLIYSHCEEGIKSSFIIKAGADPQMIRFQVEGAEKVEINEDGDLVLQTSQGMIVDQKPKAFQKKGEETIEVKVRYQIYDSLSELGENSSSRPLPIVGFSLDSYDSNFELIIDPITLVGGTYIGGPSFDFAYGVALDDFGYVYLTGYTYSASGFPLTSGPQLNFNEGDVDAFVIKIDPRESRIIYCGYLGGYDRDFAYDIAVDQEGAAYIVGYTASREDSFPVINGPDITQNGQYDVFVAKINPMGTKLEYCGFIGGDKNDFGRGIAVDLEGRAYVTGYTESNEVSFPVKKGPILLYKRNYEAFIACVSSSGKELDYCGYIGGLGHDWGYAVAVDSEGAAYIAGATSSDEYSFPVKVGPDLSFNGQVDAYVAKISPSGEEIIYCGYVGGEGEDVALDIEVNKEGLAYICGYTGSNEKTFPVTFGPDLDYNGGFYDAFVARVSVAGNYLTYCGFIGGSGYDAAFGLSVDNRGCAYVVGFTSSDQESFPVKDGPELTFHGSFDCFLAKITFNGARLVFSGYFGGSQADYAQDVVVEKDDTGNIYVVGSTYSNQFPFPLKPGFSRPFQGKREAFLVHYYEESITVTSPNGGEIWYSGLEKDITWYSTGKIGPVRIELSLDNGQSWQVIAEETENDGHYSCVVPEVTSVTCLIRISEVEDGLPADTSDFPFIILNEPIIIVTSPNGGEEWPVGSIQEIKWITGSAPVGEVKIEYSIDNGNTWMEIIDRTENDGVFEWEIPDTPSSECLIKISEADDGQPTDISDAPFTIYSPQKFPPKSEKKEEKNNLTTLRIRKVKIGAKKSI